MWGEGSASGRVGSGRESVRVGETARGEGSDARDGATTGPDGDALGREDDDRAVAGVVARDVVPSERLAHLAPAAHFPHSTSEGRVVEAYLAEAGVAGVGRHVGAHGSHDAKRAHGTLGVVRHLAEAAVERVHPRRRHPRDVASGGCLLGTSRRRGRHGRRWRSIGASRATRSAAASSGRSALGTPPEPRRGRAGRGRRASRKGRRRLWDPQPDEKRRLAARDVFKVGTRFEKTGTPLGSHNDARRARAVAVAG
jgi:hypothetical protein